MEAWNGTYNNEVPLYKECNTLKQRHSGAKTMIAVIKIKMQLIDVLATLLHYMSHVIQVNLTSANGSIFAHRRNNCCIRSTKFLEVVVVWRSISLDISFALLTASHSILSLCDVRSHVPQADSSVGGGCRQRTQP